MRMNLDGRLAFHELIKFSAWIWKGFALVALFVLSLAQLSVHTASGVRVSVAAILVLTVLAARGLFLRPRR